MMLMHQGFVARLYSVTLYVMHVKWGQCRFPGYNFLLSLYIHILSVPVILKAKIQKITRSASMIPLMLVGGNGTLIELS